MSESVEIEHRDLRSAIEFAVLVAEEANKGKRSFPYPKELRSQFGVARIPTASLGRLRRVIEADDTFRERIAVGAVPELVDPIGMLWLQRPAGWVDDVRGLLAQRAVDERDADLRTAVRREEKRRRAAEQATARSQADLVQQQMTIDELRSELDLLRADLVKADDAVAELRTELIDVRNEARHARDREAAAKARLEAAQARYVSDDAELPHSATSATSGPESGDDRESVALADVVAAAVAARELAARLDALATPNRASAEPQAQRRALRLPGGVIASSAAAAEHLLRSDGAVLVDGYNVAKLAWPALTLADQRARLLDGLENLVRRFGTDLTVVFDGSNVVGAHADRRRVVRVAYSPEGVTADDVIRDEVRRLPAGRAVIVVTNDAEIVSDVKSLGANVVPSNALIALL
jgi:hypothetical protein